MCAFFRGAIALAALLSLAACADPAIPYDRGAGLPVTTIGVLTTRWPDTPSAALDSTIGQSFGLVGGLVDLAMTEARNSQLHALVDAHHLVATNQFDTDLRAAIAADGYHVVPIDLRRSGFDYLSSYNSLTGADAWLDCVGLQWGYMAAGIGKSTPYRPDAIVKCRLVRASNQAILMRDIIYYNPVGSTGNFVSIAPDPSFAFVTFGRLTADPNRAVSGINAAFEGTAQAVGTLLK